MRPRPSAAPGGSYGAPAAAADAQERAETVSGWAPATADVGPDIAPVARAKASAARESAEREDLERLRGPDRGE